MAFDLVSYAAGTGKSVLDPLVVLWNSFVLFLPGLVAAIVIALIGYLVSHIIYVVINKLLLKVGLDKWMVKHNLQKSLGKLHLSHLLAVVLKWYIFVIFLVEAVRFLEMGALSMLLQEFVQWLPHLISAVLIILFGVVFADFVADRVLATKTKWANSVASLAKIVIIVFIVVVALQEMKVMIGIAETTFLIVVTGIVLAVALALGIGFGLGLKGEAAGMVKKFRKRYL